MQSFFLGTRLVWSALYIVGKDAQLNKTRVLVANGNEEKLTVCGLACGKRDCTDNDMHLI
jgi:hypothetical protein